MPAWVKVLLVLGVTLFLLIAGMAGFGYYMVKKISSEPGGPLAAMIRMTNPDYEVLDVNERDKTITVRHKKTGKQGTLPIEKLRNGTIDPKDVGMSNEEAGILAPPQWLQYPGSTVQSTAGDRRAVQMTLETDDEQAKVTEYYESQLKANGFSTTNVSLTRTLMGSSNDGKRSVTVQMLPRKGEGRTVVLVVLKQ
jgi:hypothetical protein